MRKRTILGSVIAVAVLVLLLALPANASAAPAPAASGSGCATFYTIKWGDNLYRIALRFGTTVAKLAALNGITNVNYIVAGKTICVKAATSSGGFWYVVKSGDTLGNIGWRYGWGSLYLAKVNGLSNVNLIYPGQRLWIPAH